MHRVAVCYRSPEDPDAFERHYRQVHVPLVLAVPGLRRFTYGRSEPMGGQRQPTPHFFVAALYFDTEQDALRGLASTEMRSAAADVANFATGGVTMYRQSEEELTPRP